MTEEKNDDYKLSIDYPRLYTIDYVWIQKWEPMSMADLKKEKLILKDKLDRLPLESRTIKESMNKVMNDLDFYIKYKYIIENNT